VTAAIAEKNLPGLDTLPGLILTFTALSGEFPTTLLRHFPGSEHYKEKTIKELKREGFLKTYYRDGLRGFRLTAAAKRRLLNKFPERFTSYLTGSTETNRLKSEVPRRFRLHQMAEVLVMMFHAGVLAFPWGKPAVFQPSLPDVSILQPAYYSSREVKELGPQAAKIRNSRATGVLLTKSDIFIIYNTGPGQMKWEYKAEMRFKAMLQIELCQRRLPAQFIDVPVNAVVFGSDMERLDALMGTGDGLSHNYFVLDKSMEHFYYLPSDHAGEVVLRLLCDGEARTILDTILMEDLLPPDSGLPVEHDALSGDTLVLFGYLCDMPRLRCFDSALSIHDRNGLVVCFDFQEEAYRRCLSPRAQLQCLDLDAVERSVFPSAENKS